MELLEEKKEEEDPFSPKLIVSGREEGTDKVKVLKGEIFFFCCQRVHLRPSRRKERTLKDGEEQSRILVFWFRARVAARDHSEIRARFGGVIGCSSWISLLPDTACRRRDFVLASTCIRDGPRKSL